MSLQTAGPILEPARRRIAVVLGNFLAQRTLASPLSPQSPLRPLQKLRCALSRISLRRPFSDGEYVRTGRPPPPPGDGPKRGSFASPFAPPPPPPPPGERVASPRRPPPQ